MNTNKQNEKKGFNEALRDILNHPFASFFIADVTLCGIANVIKAVKWNGKTYVSTDAIKSAVKECLAEQTQTTK